MRQRDGQTGGKKESVKIEGPYRISNTGKLFSYLFFLCVLKFHLNVRIEICVGKDLMEMERGLAVH